MLKMLWHAAFGCPPDQNCRTVILEKGHCLHCSPNLSCRYCKPALQGEFPVIRKKRDPRGYRGPRPAPGQTVALCPSCNKFTLFAFTKEETVRCVECSWEVSR